MDSTERLQRINTLRDTLRPMVARRRELLAELEELDNSISPLLRECNKLLQETPPPVTILPSYSPRTRNSNGGSRKTSTSQLATLNKEVFDLILAGKNEEAAALLGRY